MPRGRELGSFTPNLQLLSGEYWLESVQDNITATASGTQTTAFQITTQSARVTTVATAGDAVQLPPAQPGLEVFVVNHGANRMQVFGSPSNPFNGNVGDTIDDVATATGVQQMADSGVVYFCFTAGAWYSLDLATGYARGLGLQTMQPASIAANATGTQASGTPITSMINLVSSGGAAQSVTLPVSKPGMAIMIACTTAVNTVAVFPNAGGTTTETINALSANAGITMAALTSATFVCAVAGQWYTVPRVPS